MGSFQGGKCYRGLRQSVVGLTGSFKSGGIAEGLWRGGSRALVSVPLLSLFHPSLQTHCAENLLKADTYRKWRAAKAGEKTISVVLQVILPSPCLLPNRSLEAQGPDTALRPTGSGLGHFPFWTSASLPGKWAVSMPCPLAENKGGLRTRRGVTLGISVWPG